MINKDKSIATTKKHNELLEGDCAQKPEFVSVTRGLELHKSQYFLIHLYFKIQTRLKRTCF